MVFTTDKIPYPLNFGLDLSRYSDLIISNSIQILPDLISKLDEQNLDYIICPISLSDREIRINSLKNFTSPIFIDDYSLFAYEWRNKFTSKIHNEDLINFSEDLIKMDFDYASHIGAKFTLINLDQLVNSNINFNFFLFNKNLKKFLTENPDKYLSLQLPLNEAGLILWEKIQSELNFLENLSLVLEIKPDLPDESVIQKFATHNLKSILLPFSIFITNKNGYPVLSKLHQDYIKFLFNYKIEVIFQDDSDLLINNCSITNFSNKNKYDLANFQKIKDYSLYIFHLFKNHREFKNEEYIVYNYLDTFQIPLQPLRDNLQSQTYECFEEDNTKYDYYEMALNKALKNFREKGNLNLKNIINSTIENNTKNSTRILTACVLGGGRGPLVRKVVQSAISNNFIPGENFKIYCVEKNRNAFNTLLNLKLKEPEVFGQVNFIFSDMRNFNPVEKLDIIVSELLGSFGDNELSPECLVDVQKFLSHDSIMIPHSYTSYSRPVMCPVVWANIKKIKESYQSQYVILLHKAYYPVKEVSECFNFIHPVEDFNLYKEMKFKFDQDVVIHGFAGYFKTILYDDIELSTVPYEHTPGMFSWFPIYFPSMNPLEFKKDEELVIHILRINDGKKVWYEWSFVKESKHNSLDMSSSQVHNLGGSCNSIML